MTGMTEAMPRSPEAWKSMGCCVDFPQPWADLMWGLEFEDTCVLSSCGLSKEKCVYSRVSWSG